MYDTFQNTKFQYYYPISFVKRNKSYLCTNVPRKIHWCYGDTILIVFDIRDLDCDPETTFEDTKVQITFYDFRGEEVFSMISDDDDTCIDIEEMTVSLIFDREQSLKIKKGVYSCSVALIYDEVDYQTILRREDCEIHVR